MIGVRNVAHHLPRLQHKVVPRKHLRRSRGRTVGDMDQGAWLGIWNERGMQLT